MHFTVLDHERAQKHVVNIMSQWVVGGPDRRRSMKFTAHDYDRTQKLHVNIMSHGADPRILHNFLDLR